MADKQFEVTIRDYLKALRTKNINVQKAILYGSYARGNYRADSDIDIAIISPDFGKNYLLEGVELKLAAINFSSSISPRPYSIEDVKKTKPGDFLHDEILIKGKEIAL